MFSQIKSLAKKTPVLTVYKRFLSWSLRREGRRFETAAGEGYFCIGCGKSWKQFKPFPEGWSDELIKSGWKYSLDDAETLNYRNYWCYHCGMIDRDRLYAMYLSQIIAERGAVSIIEFAPSPPLSKFLKSMKQVTLRTSDLFMPDADDKLDIQDLRKYEDESFDIFICSHVLEHVDDDRKAMRELFRITKKGGFGIPMVPIVNGVTETHEDPSIKDKNLRMKYFGQDDHVRLYAKADFIERLESAGFRVELLDAAHFGPGVFEKHGISNKSVLYIAHK